jgi:hypothetical protein
MPIDTDKLAPRVIDLLLRAINSALLHADGSDFTPSEEMLLGEILDTLIADRERLVLAAMGDVPEAS